MSFIYLYCVTNKEPGLQDVEGLVDRLSFVYHNGVYAVVSNVREDEFCKENLEKNLSDLEWIKAQAHTHEKIIECVMKDRCVIPFKFGTIFNTEDNLKVMLEGYGEEFKTNLSNLEGKEEWGVKIYCDMEKLKESLIREDEEVWKIDEEISFSPPGKAFFLKKKKEELLNTIMTKRLTLYGREAFDKIREYALKARINKLLPKEVTERNDEMVLNSAFLVDRDKVGAFIGIVTLLKEEYNTSGFSIDCTGPWPAYNFCNLSKEEGLSGKP